MRFGSLWATRWWQARTSCAASCAVAALRSRRPPSRATSTSCACPRAQAAIPCLRNGHGGAAAVAVEDDTPPSVAEMIESFGLRVKQAMNQVVVGTVMGGAQPVAAALDYEDWPEVVGTIAGDDTVLVICPDLRRAGEVEAQLRKMLES